MNDKTAKALRRLARSEFDLAPLTTYLRNPRTGVIVVDPRCQRGLYRAMKRHITRGDSDV